MEITEREVASDDLPVLLIDVYEVSLEALIHFRRETVSTRHVGFVVQPEQDLEKNHLQTVFVEEKLTGKVVLLSKIFLTKLVACLVLVDLHSVEDLGAHYEELVSLVFIESVHHQALPQNVDLGFLEGFAVRSSSQELQKIQPLCHFLDVRQRECLVCDQVVEELPVVGLILAGGAISRALVLGHLFRRKLDDGSVPL